MSNAETIPLATHRRREYRFGDFTLDLDGGFLRRGADEVTLRPKTFAVLAYLVERHGRLVTKTELIDAIWPNTAVTDNSLSQCLLEIRRALNDDTQQVVRTLSRRGYMFAAPVSAPPLSFAREPERSSSESHPGILTTAFPKRNVANRFAGKYWALSAAVVVGAAVAVAVLWTRTPQNVTYTQLTNFTDSATSPAISPDGRMLAFIRGSRTFLDNGQLYIKMLPHGEAVALTNDSRLKMAPVFSPDGSRIAYTVADGSGAWETWSVPTLGGEPQPLLANAAALTWIGEGRVLFSEIKRGLQMGVVTATEHRSNVKDLYVPPGMAHRSAMSPDRQWVLIASEMNAMGWLPCHLATTSGSTPARIVGPATSKCTHAAWSPDGRWMYFSAESGGGFHTWRQRFPDGDPQQITFGAAEEEGVAMWPDGRSFASSVGTTSSSIWVQDEGQDRQITSEGFGFLPSFSRDAKTLYYLLRIADAREWSAGELQAVDLTTDKQRRVLPGISMAEYEVSGDGTRVLFVRSDEDNRGIWLAHLDGRLAPVQLSNDSNNRAYFGPPGTIVFTAEEDQRRYLFRVREDGSGRQKIAEAPIVALKGVSQDRRWAVVWAVADESRQLVGYPLDGGQPVLICDHCADSDGGPAARGRTPQALSWSPGGEFLYLRLQPPREPLYESGKTYVLRLSEPGSLPAGFKSESHVASMPGVTVIPHGGLFPGPRASLFAYTRTATHRNIYRISIP